MKSISTSGVDQQASAANNILLNYLRTNASSTTTMVADVSPFIPKAHILKLYQGVAAGSLNELLGKIKTAFTNYSRASTRAQRGVALSTLNKYPQFQTLISKGFIEADLDASSEMKALCTLYAKEPQRLFEAKITVRAAFTNYSRASTEAQKEVALSTLSEYPQFQTLISKVLSEADLDASAEMQALRKLYADEPLRLLEAQLAAANKYISSDAVQTQVASDFNNGEFREFDVNNGDNNCQSRIFLMEVFRKAIPYDNLTSEEKLVLTLSNITSKYKKEVRDVFGVLTKDEENGRVLQSVKVNTLIDTKATMFYSVRDLIGMAVSQISAGYLLSVADTLGRTDLKEDLTPYNRKEPNSAKLKPVQQLQAPGIEAMFACIGLNKLPFAYKITRLAGTTLSGGVMEFSLQGVALVDMNGTIINAEESSPTVVFELFAVDTPSCRKRAIRTDLERIASANSFTDYLSELQNYGMSRLIHLCDTILDRELQSPNTVNYRSASISAFAQASQTLEECLSGTYLIRNTRAMSGLVFQPCHVYVSSTQKELTKIRALEAANPVTGNMI